ncbi:unnamed protein product [Toxocara canis]|uniref:Uncharacterized protein n=1 Tax=Toxocara canis TaxID=6265 RepID=A0A3P7H6Z7_TOXCA|nr:unnamed protein product [Toxocara canis]
MEELPQISVPEPPPLPRLLEFGQTTSEASSLEAGEVFSAEASTSNGMQRTSAIGIPSVVSFDGQCSKSSMDGMNVLDNHSDKPNTIVNDAYFLPAPSSSGISVSSTWDDLLVTKSTVHQSNGSDDCLQASFNGSSDNAVPLKQGKTSHNCRKEVLNEQDFTNTMDLRNVEVSGKRLTRSIPSARPNTRQFITTVDSVEIVLGDKGHCESMRQADHLHSLTAFAGLPIDYEMRSGRSLFTAKANCEALSRFCREQIRVCMDEVMHRNNRAAVSDITADEVISQVTRMVASL